MSKSEKKKKRRVWRWIWLSLSSIVLLLVLGFFIISSTSFGKRWVTRQIVSLANKYVFEHVEIGLVEVQFPFKLQMSNVVIYDHRDSVLLSAQTLKAHARLRPLLDSNLIVKEVVVSDFFVNLSRYQGDKSFNYRYALKEQESSGDPSLIKDFFIESVILDGGSFNYHFYDRPKVHGSDGRIDYNHITAYNIEGRVDSITTDSTTRMSVPFLSCSEQSGFRLKNLSTHLVVGDEELSFINTQIRTGRGTKANVNYRMLFNDWDEFDDFENLVNIQAELSPTTLQIDDLKYFTSGLEMLSEDIDVSGDFKGVINGFWVNDFELWFDKTHYAKGDLRISDATEPDQMFIDLKLKQSLTEAQLVRKYYKEVKIPKAIDDLGRVSTTGQFTGALNDFVAYASFGTALGKVDSDIHLRLGETDVENEYSGNLDLTDFDIGKLTDNANLGEMTFESELNGRGFKLDNVYNVLKANVAYMDVNGYRYKNVTIDGITQNRFFSGSLEMRDTNANLDFSGTISFKETKPDFRFKTSIKHANLNELNLVNDQVVLKGDFRFDFSASELEDLVGTFEAGQAKLVFNDEAYDLSNARLTAVKDSLKRWTLTSDIASGHLYTNLLLRDVPDVLTASASQVFQQKKFNFEGGRHDGIMDFAVDLHQVEPLIRLWGEDLEIQPGTRMVGAIDQPNHRFFASVVSQHIRYEELDINDFQFQIKADKDSVTGSAQLGQFAVNGDSMVSDYTLDLKGGRQKLVSNHKANIKQGLSLVDLNVGIDLAQNDSNSIGIDSSSIVVQGGTYYIKSTNIEWIGKDLFEFDSLRVMDGSQNIVLSGFARTSGRYEIECFLKGLRLSNFTGYMSSYFETLSGEINGRLFAHNETGFSLVESDLKVEQIDFRGLNMDHATIQSGYENETGVLSLYSELMGRDSSKIVKSYGGIRYGDDDIIELMVELNQVPIAMFDTLLTDIVSEVDGTVTGLASIKGDLNSPQVYGYASLDSAVFTVDYLNTRYALTDSFHFDNKRIKFDRVELTDVRDQKSVITGFIEHKGFSTFNLNLDVESSNFQVLNTDENDNDLYYGTAYVTGVSRFRGPLLSTQMTLNLKTEPGTKLFLPIEEETGYTQQSFIHFVNTESDEPAVEVEESDDDFALDMNFQLTDAAEVQLIFDKQLGDVIKANGNGNIRMVLSPGGDFEMFGDYIIESGNYLFTAFDLINKRFKVKQGSKVSWVGDPYDALIDIMAYYELKANAYMLVSALENVSSDQLTSTTVPVEARASLKGSLLRPEIKLSFELIDNGVADVSLIKRELNALNLSQEEIDKQVVSLLVLNRFMPVYTGGGNAAGNAFSSGYEASLGDFVSNQLTNWLSSIDEDLSVNFTYSGAVYSGDESVVLSQSELELALSYSFFNDRVQVNYAYEFQNNYRPNTEVSYKANKDGTLRFKLFNRQSQNPLITQDTKTYGIGVFFRREFNSIRELFQSKNKKKETTE